MTTSLMSNGFVVFLFAMLIMQTAGTGAKRSRGKSAATSSGSGPGEHEHNHNEGESGDEQGSQKTPKKIRLQVDDDTPMSIGPTVFITGANAGIGLEFVKQLVEHPGVEYIFATYRDANNSQELLQLAKDLVKKSDGTVHHDYAHVIPVVMELDEDKSIATARETVLGYLNKFANGDRTDYYYKTQLKKAQLNLIINNAGILDSATKDPGVYVLTATRNAFMKHINVNTMGTMITFNVFRELMPKREEIGEGQSLPGAIFVSSSISSIGHHLGLRPHKSDAYAMSKTAVNYLMKAVTMNPATNHIISISICPGFVDTKMARNANDQKEAFNNEEIKEKGAVTVDKSVSQMLHKFRKLKYHESGNFYTPLVFPVFKEQTEPYTVPFIF